MRKFNAALAAMAFLFAAGSADASVFDFSYAGAGVTGSGTLTANLIAPGEYQVVSGTDIVVGGVVNGVLALFANPGSPAAAYSPSQFFIYDDLLFSNLDPFINNNGLLFVDTAGREVNVYSNGPDAYVHYDNTGFNESVSFSLTEVPEPASIAMLVFGLVCLGVIRRRRSRAPMLYLNEHLRKQREQVTLEKFILRLVRASIEGCPWRPADTRAEPALH